MLVCVRVACALLFCEQSTCDPGETNYTIAKTTQHTFAKQWYMQYNVKISLSRSEKKQHNFKTAVYHTKAACMHIYILYSLPFLSSNNSIAKQLATFGCHKMDVFFIGSV